VFSVACLLDCGVVLTIIESLAGLESLVERRSGVSLWGVGAILYQLVYLHIRGTPHACRIVALVAVVLAKMGILREFIILRVQICVNANLINSLLLLFKD
jgi:hypothetical protein